MTAGMLADAADVTDSRSRDLTCGRNESMHAAGTTGGRSNAAPAAFATQSNEDWLTVLPDELVDAICAQLAASLDGPADLARVAKSCQRLRTLVRSADFARRRGEEREQANLSTLEQLAVLEVLRNIGTNRLVYEGASIALRAGSRARCEDFAKLMLRHPSLTVSVEAHTGRNAPEGFAPAFTKARAMQGFRYLARLGVGHDRITACNGWGKDVAIAAGWQPGIESARAELFFRLPVAAVGAGGGAAIELPSRPCYYAGRMPPPLNEPDEVFSALLLDSDDEDDADASTEDSDTEDSELNSASVSDAEDVDADEEEGVDAAIGITEAAPGDHSGE